MIRPRWLARLLAAMRGQWWLPCPVCHKGFAAFESGTHELFNPGFSIAQTVCARLECQEYAIRWNRRLSREAKAAGGMWLPGYLEDKYKHLD